MITDARQDRQQSADLDEQRLDPGGRFFASSITRRRACHALGGGALGAVFTSLGLSDVLARCNGVGERCRRNSQCCSGRCRRKKCRRARGSSEPTGPEIDPPSPVDTPLPPDYDLPILPTEERRKVAISGTIDITDDETFGGDEVCRHRVEEVYLDDFRYTSLFGGSTFDTVRFSRGCGGEVRVEVAVIAHLRSNGDISISGQVKLYEGTSEGTSDLDGRENLPTFSLPKGDTVSKTVTVHNADEGGDHATVRLTFRNVAA